MEVVEFLRLREKVIKAGYGEEITWQETVGQPDTADEFLWQYIWVVISSGMKNQVARIIEQRIIEGYNKKWAISTVFNHKGKVKAIEYMFANHDKIFEQYLEAEDRLEFLQSLPYVGEVTKFHLAKNLGEDIIKPDRHLVRIAGIFKTNCFDLCDKLAEKIGCRRSTVDIILWRAGNLGFI